ncbi:MAG: polysaccharide biosynthesis tyrosine autokinase [Pseudomonadota bacterium]
MNYNDPRYPIERGGAYRGVVAINDPDRTNMLYPSEAGYYDEPDDIGIDFWGVVRVLWLRKWMILAITLLGLAVAFMLTLRVVPLYIATTTIEIQSEDVQIIEGTNVGPDLVADSTYMETQYRLLRSRFLAERVAEELNLINDDRYAFAGSPRDVRVLQAARRIVGGLRVAPAGRSRVVGVSFVSAYPQEAARIANAVAETFIQSNLERKYNTTAFAREFLDERLATTKTALEESERKLVEYAENQDLLDIAGNTSGAGSLDENSILALNNELSDAESERIKAEQAYRAAIETPPYRELLQSTTLTQLRQSRSTLLSDYQEMLGRFKPDYPDMVRLQTRIDLIEDDIQAESDAISSSILTDFKVAFDAAVAREESLRSRVAELRLGLQDERNRRIEYRILQREVETIRAQYEALLQRSKEVSIASGVGSSNISIVDPALVPGRPFQPNLMRSMLQALVVSLALGVGLAFALNFIDNTIKTPEDLRNKLGIPAIGVIPKLSRKKDVIVDVLNEPKSQISEAFASARTALEFATEEGAPRSLLITSTRPGEGKTSTTIALATTFAKGGKSVLIIDADMRKPSFVIDSGKSIGLSGLLTGHDALHDHVVRSKTEGLSILPSGVIPPNPAQILSGPRLREIIEAAEQLFDLVIIDSPPVLSFTDSPRLGSVVEGALIVVQAGSIRTPAAKRTVAQMFDARTNVLGGVLTKFDAKKAGYEYSYYYSSYGRRAYAYVENDKKGDSKRRVMIEAAPDDDENDETELWA